MKVVLKASAKINLLLDILGQRDDGYHLVQMILQSVDLQDIITITSTGNQGELKVVCNGNDNVPQDETNTAYKAAKCFFEETGTENTGVSIKIKKKIPVSAGLAGGSADAAAVIAGLNELFHCGLNDKKLADIGELIGADVPFCLQGGTMLAEGIGTILSPLPDMPDCAVLLCKPEAGVFTAEAYKDFDNLSSCTHPDFEDVSDAICIRSLDDIGKNIANVFEQSIKLPEIAAIKQIMYSFGAVGACMSGSGPTVFGLFKNHGDADRCCSELREHYPFAVVCEPCSNGVEFDN